MDEISEDEMNGISRPCPDRIPSFHPKEELREGTICNDHVPW